jgi:serine/threonine protein kinase
MGEVYKARDTRLDRTVAIKVLSQQLSSTPEARTRFEREAKTIAALNHPNICTLYDIGMHEGADYLVMEYLEGESLAHRLEGGALPLAEALKIAMEIADALDKAHRQRVTHRDLKPGNIMLTKSGAKLLDFGLAKITQESQPAAALSALPTNASLTAQGTILGTLQYMAPEQLEGREVDARTDIFAFGAVLYEMVTGQRAFEGKSQASLISAIMSATPPPLSTLQPVTPPLLEKVVTTALAKDPDDRWQTARDLRLQLKWIADGTELGSKPSGEARRDTP